MPFADAGKRLARAGWTVEEITEIPPFAEAADLQMKLWLSDGYDALRDMAEREGDPGALAILRDQEKVARSLDLAVFSKLLTRRATLVRAWEMFFETYAVIVMPPCGELPFEWQLDLKGDASLHRVIRAQMPQIALPVHRHAGPDGLDRFGRPRAIRCADRGGTLQGGSLPCGGRGDRSGRRGRQARSIRYRPEGGAWR